MPNPSTTPASREIEVTALNGWFMLFFNLGLLCFGLGFIVFAGFLISDDVDGAPLLIPIGILMEIVGIILLTGHFTLQPNEGRLLILFGAYKGTVRRSGFFWANPFYARASVTLNFAQSGGTSPRNLPAGGPARSSRIKRYKISLRARTLNMEIIKVNDKRGNPVEIAAVVVWRVQDTAQAMFDVDDYEKYVQSQSESALRHLASAYDYDHSEGEEHAATLRGGGADVTEALKGELQERLLKAGVIVDETRLTHLAYAPEIAQVMLRRQQAEAVIAARKKIVQGAVSMVEMALIELSERNVVQLDDERKAAMVSNLLVVLCGETEASPVINTGTLYN
jgi:regulator of protease activity HflC (stomatin/prohibitin superfamily)